MTDGVSRRSQIDSDTVKGLQLMNGGSAAALTAMLPNILSSHGFRPLAGSMLVAITLNAIGLAAAVIHNRLRRKCSLEYSKPHELRDRPYRSRLLRWCSSVPNEPAICTRSVIHLWLSLSLFLFGIVSVMIGAGRIMAMESMPSPAECWEIREVAGTLLRIDRCTGAVLAIGET